MSGAFDALESGGLSAGLNFIEQLHANASANCSNPMAPMLIGRHPKHTHEAIVTIASCKSWSCPECSARMGKKWIATALHHINKSGGSWFFMTLTAHKNMRTPARSKKSLADGWRKLSLRMKRAYGKFDYMRVWELHKNGAYHHHYILNAEMPFKKYYDSRKKRYAYTCRWLKDNAAACGMGYQVDYRPIDNPAFVAGYVAKYTLKAAEPDTARNWIKHTRRIETSYGWTRLPDDSRTATLDWQIAGNKTALYYWFEHFKSQGVTLFPVWLDGEPLTYRHFPETWDSNKPDRTDSISLERPQNDN